MAASGTGSQRGRGGALPTRRAPAGGNPRLSPVSTHPNSAKYLRATRKLRPDGRARGIRRR